LSKPLLFCAGYATLAAYFFGLTRGSRKGFWVHKGVFKLVLTGLFLATAWSAGVSSAKEAPAFVAEPTVALASLSPQARTTYNLVLQGGPFPYDKDGDVFGNRERQLPSQPRGYYREYTVKTPGASNRGARRIVCGGQRATAPQACYFTADHYASFRKIVP
jgi:ribonuclease T1